MDEINLKQILSEYSLGNLLSPLKTISGGLLHKIWFLHTSQGEYALKVLNPEIMRRPEALNNYINSEKIAKKALAGGVPAVVAIEAKNKVVFQVEDKFVMVYPWINGHTLSHKQITLAQAKIIGSLLAKIHQLKLDLGKPRTPKINNAWKEYLRLDQMDVSFVEELMAKISQFREDIAKLELTMVVSHSDLDKKNVLWKDENNPVIIDWESAGYVNPEVELMIAAIDWGDLKKDSGNLEIFKVVVQSYKAEGGKLSASPEVIFYRSIEITLNWLEYNIRRSYEEQFREEERRLGKEEVQKTIKELRILNNTKEELIKIWRVYIEQLEANFLK